MWCGELQPTSLSERYRIRLDVRRSRQMIPKAYVVSPRLKKRNGEAVPHLYDQATSQLCLWHPDRGEWTPDMWIVDSVLLWTAEWLFFYEIWFATGEWIGGGEHPPIE